MDQYICQIIYDGVIFLLCKDDKIIDNVLTFRVIIDNKRFADFTIEILSENERIIKSLLE